MSADSLFAVARSGLDHERTRLEAATRGIAMANTPLDPSKAAGKSDFAGALGLPPGGAERLVRDPSNPMADAHGMVHYPKVDLVAQMGTLIEASRGYEANLRAFNALHSMALSALDIGKDA